MNAFIYSVLRGSEELWGALVGSGGLWGALGGSGGLRVALRQAWLRVVTKVDMLTPHIVHNA